MTCDTARDLLAFRRPGGPTELPPDDLAALDGHLAGCPACAAAARRQDRFDAAIATAMKGVPVPAGLRTALLRQAADRRVARFRRTAGLVAAVAAAVVAVVGLGYGVRRAAQPGFDTEGFARLQDGVAEAPQLAVADWLKANGLPPELPLPVDYRHLAFHGKESVFGRDVPVVVFQRWQPGQFRPDALKLYLFRGDQFRFESLQDVASSLYTAAVVKDDRDGSGVVTVALYNTPDVTPFLTRRPLQN